MSIHLPLHVFSPACVNDHSNIINGDARLGDIGCQNNLSNLARRSIKDQPQAGARPTSWRIIPVDVSSKDHPHLKSNGKAMCKWNNPILRGLINHGY